MEFIFLKSFGALIYVTDSYNGGGGAVLPPGWPSGSRSGPSGHQLAMKKASEEAARKSCRSAIRGHIYPACEARVTEIYRADMNVCSSSAVSGAVATGVGGVALGIVAIAAAPVTLAVVGVASLVAIVGGGALTTYSTTTCMNQAEWNRDDNLKTCEASVTAGQSKACNF